MARKQKQKQKQSQSVRVVVNVGKRSGGKGKTQKQSAPPPMTGMMLNRILPPIPLGQAPPPAPDFTTMLMATLAGITGTQKKDTVGPAPVSKETMKPYEAEEKQVARSHGRISAQEIRDIQQGQGPAQPAVSARDASYYLVAGQSFNTVKEAKEASINSKVVRVNPDGSQTPVVIMSRPKKIVEMPKI